jgi:heme-degrading monooxygenase HmoA
MESRAQHRLESSGPAAPASGRARIVFLVRVPVARRDEFLAAYETIRYEVARGVPGHLVDQICHSDSDPEQWLITSEWRSLEDFRTWEGSDAHRELVRPMRECMTEARSLRFAIQAETRGGGVTSRSASGSASGSVPSAPTPIPARVAGRTHL